MRRREEMLASALYLQQQETGLGDRFLDAIICVGYRVKSREDVHFR